MFSKIFFTNSNFKYLKPRLHIGIIPCAIHVVDFFKTFSHKRNVHGLQDYLFGASSQKYVHFEEF